MPKKDESKLTEEFKISKNSSRILSTTKDLDRAVQILRRGGVIIFPTDTVYGIGARWDSEIAIARIRRIKGSSQNFPILLKDRQQAHQFVKFSTAATNLANRFWPGPLTLILQAQNADQKIGARIPDSALVKTLIEKSGFPLIGTSANFHGHLSPTTFSQIDKDLIKKVDFVIRGTCKYRQESTVVDATVDPPKILRRGAGPYGFEN